MEAAYSADMRRILSIAILVVAGVLLLGIPSVLAVTPAQRAAIFAVAAGLSLFASRIIVAKRAEVLLTLEHETAHLILSCLCGRHPVSLIANGDGSGSFTSRGNGRTPVAVKLAPYVLPLSALLVDVLLLPLEVKHTFVLAAFIGALTGFSLARISLELHLGQTDLREVGIIAAPLVAIFLPIFLMATMLMAVGGGSLILRWIDGSISVVVDFASRVIV
jgi:hypothetical protein